MNSLLVCYVLCAVTFTQVLSDCDIAEIKAQVHEIEGLYKKLERDVEVATKALEKGAKGCLKKGPVDFWSCVVDDYHSNLNQLKEEVKQLNETLINDWDSILVEIKTCEQNASASCPIKEIETEIEDINSAYNNVTSEVESAVWTLDKGVYACKKEGYLKFIHCVYKTYKLQLKGIETDLHTFEKITKTDIKELKRNLEKCV